MIGLRRYLPSPRELKARISPLLHQAALLSRASVCLAWSQRAMRIIMLHGVGDDAYPVEVLQAQLRYLDSHFRVVPLDLVVAKARDPGARFHREVALTFDDGLRNNLTKVYPLLRSMGLPATFYVCPGVIEEGGWIWTVEARVRLNALGPPARRDLAHRWGLDTDGVEQMQGWMKTLADVERRRVFAELEQASSDYRPSARDHDNYDVMTWEELGRLDPDIITIGSHTVTHPMLTKCTPQEQAYEIRESQEWLQRRLGRAVRHFCYPDACHNESVVRLTAECYDSAVTDVGLVRRGAEPYRLFRVPVAFDVPYLAWRLHRPHA